MPGVTSASGVVPVDLAKSCASSDDHGFQVGVRLDLTEQLGVAVVGKSKPCLGVGEQAGRVVTAVTGVDRHHRGTELGDREPGERERRCVVEHDRNVVTLPDAVVRE